MPDFSSLDLATKALNDLTAQEAAEKARIDAAVGTALGAVAVPARTIFLDAVAGLDTNDGSTAVLAVKTPGQALALIGAGQRGTVVLLSDVAVTAPLGFVGTALFMSYGALADGSVPGGVKRTVTFTPAAMPSNANPAPNYALSVFAGSIVFFGVNIAVGAITAGGGIMSTPGRFEFWYNSITFDPACTVPLIYPVNGCSVFFNNTTLPANYSGKIFAGVTPGASPNSAALRTNLATA